MGVAGPLLIRPRSPYDPVVSTLASVNGGDSSWNDWKYQTTLLVRRGRDVGWFNGADALFWRAFPTLTGASVKINLKAPTTAYAITSPTADSGAGYYAPVPYGGFAFNQGGRFDSGLAFTSANAHTLLQFFNSNSEVDFTTAVSGARSSGAQIQFNPRTSLNKITMRSGPITNLPLSSKSSLGLCGVARYSNTHLLAALAGGTQDCAFTNTGSALPTGNCFIGAISSTALDAVTGSQTHLGVLDAIARGAGFSADWIADMQEAVADWLTFFDQLTVDVAATPLGDSWFRRDHITQVTPAGALVMAGPTAPPINDNQTNVSTVNGPGYARFPITVVQTEIDPVASPTWLQTGVTVAGRLWKPRVSLPNRKCNVLVGVPRVFGRPAAVDYSNFNEALWAFLGCLMFLGGLPIGDILTRLNAMGANLGDTWDTPDSKLFSYAHTVAHAETIFAATRLGYSVATDIVSLPDAALAIVPNGKATIVRVDDEERDFIDAVEFLDQAIAADAIAAELGFYISWGLNALQASASSGITPDVISAVLALPRTFSAPITARNSPPGGDLLADLTRELAFYPPELHDGILLQVPIGPFGRIERATPGAGQALMRIANQFVIDHGLLGYSETPGNAVYGGDYTTPVNICRARLYGILIPTDPNYPAPPTPPVVHARDALFAALGALPAAATLARSTNRSVFDFDGVTLIDIAANVGRFDHDALGNPQGLRIEQAATNSFLHSSEFDNAFWAANARAAVSVVNGRLAPDGTVTMDKLTISTTAAGTHLIAPSGTSSFTAGLWYTQQIVFAAAGETFAYMTLPSQFGGGLNAAVHFDLANGVYNVVNANAVAFMRRLANDNWLVSISALCNTTGVGAVNCGTATSLVLRSYAGVVGNGIWLWGAQFVQSDAALIPIATTSATVTASADDVSWTAPEALTDTAIYCSGTAALGAGAGKQYLWCAFAGTSTWEGYRDTDRKIHVVTKVSGTETSHITSVNAVADGAFFAVTARRAATDFAADFLGETLQTSAGLNGGADPGTFTSVYLGSYLNRTAYLNGALATFQTKTGKVNADLTAAITAGGFPLEGA